MSIPISYVDKGNANTLCSTSPLVFWLQGYKISLACHGLERGSWTFHTLYYSVSPMRCDCSTHLVTFECLGV